METFGGDAGSQIQEAVVNDSDPVTGSGSAEDAPV